MPIVENINPNKKKVIIADVDDTICESCQLVSDEMALEISRLIDNGFSFAFISGTKSESLQRMISSKLRKEHHILGTTGTNYTLVKGDSSVETIYKYSLSTEEKKEIFDAFDKLIKHYNIESMTTKEDQVQDRDSQITLSAIGRHAPTEAKATYDSDGKVRLMWIEFLKNHLDSEKYHLKIGGTTSIDITKKGFDKEWGIKKFAKHNNINYSEILFFGDKLYPGGNDFPAAKIVDCIAVKNPEDTIRKLKEYFLIKK
jgi:phosphomannomutase